MKKTIRVKSPVPLLVSAAVWLAWALFLPMYSAVHFIILIIVSAGLGIASGKIFKPKEFQVEQEVFSSTGDADVDELINTGRQQVKQLRALNDRISHPEISARITRMEYLSGKIFDRLTEDKSKYRQVRRFMNYYLPTSIELLTKYENLSRQGVSGGNIASSMANIEGVMDTVVTAFEKQLDNLFADTAMDVSADIQVMNDLIRAQGLSNSDNDFKGKAAQK